MKYYIGEVINVYDGDFIGWTTATLLRKVGNVEKYERWIMITEDGSELRRILDIDEKHSRLGEYYAKS